MEHIFICMMFDVQGKSSSEIATFSLSLLPAGDNPGEKETIWRVRNIAHNIWRSSYATVKKGNPNS